MNLLLVETGEVDDRGRVRLTDRRADHLRKVLRVEPGRVLRAGVLGGDRFVARVERVSAEGVDLCLEGRVPDGGRRWVVDLVVGLPRPQALHRLLQVAAGMEVRTLHLTRSWRVEKSFFHSPSLQPDKIRRQLLLGAEQGDSVHLPDVRLHPRFRECLEDLDVAAERRWIADPGASDPLPVDLDPRPAILAFGPEGGWIERETESLAELGFRSVALGPWILKVEMAVTAALAQLHRLRI